MVERSFFHPENQTQDIPHSDASLQAEQVVFDKDFKTMEHAAGCGCNACHGVFEDTLDELFAAPDVPQLDTNFKNSMWDKMTTKQTVFKSLDRKARKLAGKK